MSFPVIEQGPPVFFLDYPANTSSTNPLVFCTNLKNPIHKTNTKTHSALKYHLAKTTKGL
jgi:hypothetical protein